MAVPTWATLPAPSMRGPASPYFRFLPRGTVIPAQSYPRLALAAGQTPAALPPGGPTQTLMQAAQSRVLPTGTIGLPAAGQTGAGAGVAGPPAASSVARGIGASAAGGGGIPMGPATTAATSSVDDIVAQAARAATSNPGAATAARASSAGVPFFLAGEGAAAGAATQAPGLLTRAGLANALSGVRNLGPGGMVRAGIPALVGSVGGNMLDESQLLGGSESAANDTASKVLKWGGTGAAIGSVVPGVGTALGAGIGGVIGVLHEGAERQGWLGTPTKAEQAVELLNTANSAAVESGLPDEIRGQLQAAYDAEARFIDPEDKTAQLDLAQRYHDTVKQATLEFASNPDAFNTPETSEAAAREAALADNLIMQSVMVNAVKPYADGFIARSNAQADSFDQMAAGAGDLAPMYREMAASTRASGARQAMEIVQQAQITPYQQAAQNQANYLKQISQGIMSQAIGQVMNPQQPAAGSADLTAIIDQYAGQLQP